MLKGDGTAGNPYKIATAADLLEFADKVNNKNQTSAWAELTADIDLSSVCSKEKGNWTPIGNSINQYRGTFNGANYTISGLYINRSADYQGLFGYVSTDDDNTGTVKDLTVSGSVSGNNYVGGVVGLNRGSVKDCDFTGSVSGSYYVGGVVGDNEGTVENCYNTGAVNNSGNRVGGVVGLNRGSVKNCYNTGNISGGISGGVVGDNRGTVENCYNTGNISGGNSYVGGVVGDNSGPVKNCHNTGTVTGTGDYVGGVVGYNISSVTNCYNTGTVSGIKYVGGVVGQNSDGISASASVTNCYNTGKVSGSSNSDVGGVVGYNEYDGIVANCYFLQGTAEKGSGNDSAEGAKSLTGDEFKKQNSFTDWDFGIADTYTWTIHSVLGRPVLNENKEGGDGSPDSPYEIFTADELKNFATAVNNGSEKSAHAKLMNNIDLNPDMKISEDGTVTGAHDQWIPIGNDAHQYIGTFDGNGKTIENLYIKNTTSDYYQGLFGRFNGTVQDLTVSGSVSVSDSDHVGGIVGYNSSGTVTNCAFTGSVSGSEYVGGVVGYNHSSGRVKNCYNTGKVSGSDQIGGVVGRNQGGSVQNCYNTSSVKGD